jgi:hypothetical protein
MGRGYRLYVEVASVGRGSLGCFGLGCCHSRCWRRRFASFGVGWCGYWGWEALEERCVLHGPVDVESELLIDVWGWRQGKYLSDFEDVVLGLLRVETPFLLRLI